ncbi:MAG TPA: hypothetical protein VNP73_02685, partial [Actinomycetota bacterium]|nr:hypothetical protein [Actinomycetota bacterium]
MYRRLTLLGTLAALGMLVTAVPPAIGQETCEPWERRTIAEGLDRIENLIPDGKGGMLISAGPRNAIERVTPDGEVTTAYEDVPGPGGLRIIGHTLYAVTNGNIVDGVTDSPNGKIETFDLKSGERNIYSEGLTAPNGLVI